MKRKIIGQCPVCGADMKVMELQCPNCNIGVSGRFDLGNFSRLTPDQLDFVEVFVKLRGNIKEVEEELGISYPTVRKKLDEVVQTLGYDLEEGPEEATVEERKDVLEALDEGEINSQEAIEKLEDL